MAVLVTLTVLLAHSVAGWLAMALAVLAAAVAFGMIAGSAFDLLEGTPRAVPVPTHRPHHPADRAA